MNHETKTVVRAAEAAYEGALRDVLRESAHMFKNDQATQGLVRMLVERVKGKHS